jgi:hypothetical protein
MTTVINRNEGLQNIYVAKAPEAAQEYAGKYQASGDKRVK